MLKSLPQLHSSKASIRWHSVFIMVQLSHLYMTPGKTIASTIHTFVSEVMSLLFNTLFRFVIAFLPRNKHLLISWLLSPSAVMLEPKKIKSVPQHNSCLQNFTKPKYIVAQIYFCSIQQDAIPVFFYLCIFNIVLSLFDYNGMFLG